MKPMRFLPFACLSLLSLCALALSSCGGNGGFDDGKSYTVVTEDQIVETDLVTSPDRTVVINMENPNDSHGRDLNTPGVDRVIFTSGKKDIHTFCFQGPASEHHRLNLLEDDGSYITGTDENGPCFEATLWRGRYMMEIIHDGKSPTVTVFFQPRDLRNYKKEVRYGTMMVTTNACHSCDLGEIKIQGRPDLLKGTDLTGSDLHGANLSFGDLSGTILHGANLSYANLRGATLVGADLSSSSLVGATLSESNQQGANLSGADLTDAKTDGVVR